MKNERKRERERERERDGGNAMEKKCTRNYRFGDLDGKKLPEEAEW